MELVVEPLNKRLNLESGSNLPGSFLADMPRCNSPLNTFAHIPWQGDSVMRQWISGSAAFRMAELLNTSLRSLTSRPGHIHAGSYDPGVSDAGNPY